MESSVWDNVLYTALLYFHLTHDRTLHCNKQMLQTYDMLLTCWQHSQLWSNWDSEVPYAIHQQHGPQCFATCINQGCLRLATSPTGVWYIRSCLMPHIWQTTGLRSGLFRSHINSREMNFGVHTAVARSSDASYYFPHGDVAAVRKWDK